MNGENRGIRFDSTMLEAIVGDDQEMRRDLIQQFLETTRSDIEKVSEVIEQQDWHGASRLGHRIKGAARIVGAELLASWAEDLERQPPPLQPVFQELNQEFLLLEQELRKG
ncbi:Hpt domain-containing protein [Endozoicomonadaceae bacterium StTr2]